MKLIDCRTIKLDPVGKVLLEIKKNDGLFGWDNGYIFSIKLIGYSQETEEKVNGAYFLIQKAYSSFSQEDAKEYSERMHKKLGFKK